MAESPKLLIVCSDRTRCGKTLTARLYGDFLLLTGRDPQVFDTAPPPGGIIDFYPERTRMVDFSRTTGQVALFDTILASPGRDSIVDLATLHLQHFFNVITEIDFLAEADRVGMLVCILYVTDRSASSLRTARDIKERSGVVHLFTVCNEGGGLLIERDGLSYAYSGLTPGSELVVPALDHDVIEAVEHPVFSFVSVVEGRQGRLSESELLRLLTFLNQVLPAIRQQFFGLDLSDLRRLGFL